MGRKKSNKQPTVSIADVKPDEKKEEATFFEFGAKPQPLSIAKDTSVSPPVPVQIGTSPPPENVVIVEGGCIDTPLSTLMSQSADVACAICGKPLPLDERNVKTVVLNGERWMACKTCYMPA